MRNTVIIASDSFKGSLSSREVGEAAATAITAFNPALHTLVIPVADGGEGTVEAIVSALNGKIEECEVTGPIRVPVKAFYGMCGDVAVIEMASASGLTLVPEDKRNPWYTTSYGTGQLIIDALARGCRKFLIGLGGSATNDAGVGMLKALGYRFLDSDGIEIGDGGGEVRRIATIDSSEVADEVKEASFTVACDVTNPLTGPNGASHIFGPQKGADPAMADLLDSALSAFAKVVAATYGHDLSLQPGAGAAGGLGFAFIAFLGATLKPGIEMVLDAVEFDSKLKDARLVITGEGRLDKQTCLGKTPYGVLTHAKKMGVPVIAIGGAVAPDAMPQLMAAGFSAVFPIVQGPISLQEALKPATASRNVERTVNQIMRTWYIGR